MRVSECVCLVLGGRVGLGVGEGFLDSGWLIRLFVGQVCSSLGIFHLRKV